uniref:Uncharacterized protein n=1 Tax=Micrurus lemniscatus lemniscatus TaxID=129467 RepID=A0A2D4IIF8_MICLE
MEVENNDSGSSFSNLQISWLRKGYSNSPVITECWTWTNRLILKGKKCWVNERKNILKRRSSFRTEPETQKHSASPSLIIFMQILSIHQSENWGSFRDEVLG